MQFQFLWHSLAYGFQQTKQTVLLAVKHYVLIFSRQALPHLTSRGIFWYCFLQHNNKLYGGRAWISYKWRPVLIAAKRVVAEAARAQLRLATANLLAIVTSSRAHWSEPPPKYVSSERPRRRSTRSKLTFSCWSEFAGDNDVTLELFTPQKNLNKPQALLPCYYSTPSPTSRGRYGGTNMNANGIRPPH